VSAQLCAGRVVVWRIAFIFDEVNVEKFGLIPFRSSLRLAYLATYIELKMYRIESVR
jgi:hypothetical protein